jgi:murein DD-endopeptidase MepM/ murein hydrolase activator NlpD
MRIFLLCSAFFMVYITCGCAVHQVVKPSNVVSYKIKKGDSLAAIADRYRLSLRALIELNDLQDPDVVEIGQIIYLPADARHRIAIASLQREKGAEVNSFRPISRQKAQSIVGPLTWPVVGGELSSPFGQRASGFHEGLDIRAEEGSEVLAAHAGEVAYVGDEWQGYGNMIVVVGAGFCTVYAHNNRNLVSEGDLVEPGQQIATVGMTGTATGPHLHFEVRIEREDGYKAAVDPLALRIKNASQVMAKNTLN